MVKEGPISVNEEWGFVFVQKIMSKIIVTIHIDFPFEKEAFRCTE